MNDNGVLEKQPRRRNLTNHGTPLGARVGHHRHAGGAEEGGQRHARGRRAQGWRHRPARGGRPPRRHVLQRRRGTRRRATVGHRHGQPPAPRGGGGPAGARGRQWPAVPLGGADAQAGRGDKGRHGQEEVGRLGAGSGRRSNGAGALAVVGDRDGRQRGGGRGGRRSNGHKGGGGCGGSGAPGELPTATACGCLNSPESTDSPGPPRAPAGQSTTRLQAGADG